MNTIQEQGMELILWTPNPEPPILIYRWPNLTFKDEVPDMIKKAIKVILNKKEYVFFDYLDDNQKGNSISWIAPNKNIYSYGPYSIFK